MKLTGTNAKLTIKSLDVTIEGDDDAIRDAGRVLGDVLAGTLGVDRGELANRRAGERLARDMDMLDDTLGQTVEPVLRDRCRT